MSASPTTAPLPRYFRSRDAARHLGVSVSTFFDLCRRGILPKPTKLGRLSFWPPAALIEAFDAHIASCQKAA